MQTYDEPIRTCEDCGKPYIGAAPLCLPCRFPKPIATAVRSCVVVNCSECGRETTETSGMCHSCMVQEYGEPEDERRYMEPEDIAAMDAGVKRWGPL